MPRAAFVVSLSWKGKEGRGQFFVEGEELFDVLAVVLKRPRAVADVNGAVEVGVSFHECGRHREFLSGSGKAPIFRLSPKGKSEDVAI